MANEITVTPNLKLANGNLTDTLNPGAISFNQNTQKMFKDTIALTAATDTSLTALITGVTTYGWVYVWNLDTTNYVQLGPDNAGAIVPMVRLAKKGEPPAIFRMEPGITLRAKANTGNCVILIGVLND